MPAYSKDAQLAVKSSKAPHRPQQPRQVEFDPWDISSPTPDVEEEPLPARTTVPRLASPAPAPAVKPAQTTRAKSAQAKRDYKPQPGHHHYLVRNIPDDLYSALDAYAEQNGHSINYEILAILRSVF